MVAVRQPWEVGSEFHWLGFPEGPFITWPQPSSWFALGREILLSIWKNEAIVRLGSRLLLPSYFCPHVTKAWREAGVDVRRYADDPTRPHPDWDTLDARSGDVILAVNYFGVRESSEWYQWHRQNDSVVLIEDHSHDPVSRWALDSKADYAFASLRKTLPVPDGAIVWSPKSKPLPAEPAGSNWLPSALKLVGMIWKQEYLDGCVDRGATKETYRQLQIDGEMKLENTRNLSISPWSRALLATGYPVQWRWQREKNVRQFLDLVSRVSDAQALFLDWPAGHCPFNVVLQFPSQGSRDEARNRLITSGVYPAIHWTLGRNAPRRAIDLSSRVLTIPLDQRYDAEDVRRVAGILRNPSARLAG